MLGRICVAVLMSCTVALAQNPPVKYQAEPIPLPPGRNITLTRLNNYGLLGGAEMGFQCSPKICLPFFISILYNGNTFQQVPGMRSVIRDLNDLGNFVGDGDSAAYVSGTIFTADHAQLLAINNLDVAVGSVTIPRSPTGFATQCAVITTASSMFCLGDNYDVTLVDINDRGDVVGYIVDWSAYAQITQTFTYGFVRMDEQTTFFEPPEINGVLLNEGFPAAINNSGEVAGNAYHNGFNSFVQRSYRWSNGQMTLLDLLPGDVKGEAVGINDAGTVIGYSGQHPIVSFHGSAVFAIADLLTNCPGCPISTLYDINNRDQILTGSYINGQFVQMLLVPISQGAD